MEVLPAATQLLMLVAAAEPVGAPALVWRAAERLGIGAGAVAPAADAGLLTISERMTFRHPLVRSAVYRAASPPERRAVHEALAGATDPQADPDRRAWHRAQAAPGPDGSCFGAGALGEPGPGARRIGRGGRLPGTRGRADRGPGAPGRTGAGRGGGHVPPARSMRPWGCWPPWRPGRRISSGGPGRTGCAAKSRSPPAAAVTHPLLCLKAARQFEPLDVRLARETYLDALAAATFAGGLALGGGMREVAEAARMAPPPPGPTRGPDLLLDGLSLVICEGYPAGAPVLRRAVSAFRGTDVSRDEGLRWLWLACRAALIMWDYDSCDVLSDRQVALARDAGALITLPIVFNMRATAHLFAGEFAEAASMVAQAESVTEATGSSIAPYGAVALAAFRGQEAQAAQLIQTATDDAGRRGEGRALSHIGWAAAVLCNSLGRYEEALAAAQRASDDSPAVQFASWALVELVEAAVRSAVPGRAADALQRLSGIDPLLRDRLGAGGRGPLAGAGQRRRGRREPVP